MTYIPDTLRSQIIIRAQELCEYCLLPQMHSYYTHEIDHIYAEKHGGQTDETNLSLACAECNRHKGSDLCSLDPQDGAVVALFHPRRQLWREHFRLDASGLIMPLTAQGRVTARILGFNRVDLVADRARLIKLGVYEI